MLSDLHRLAFGILLVSLSICNKTLAQSTTGLRAQEGMDTQGSSIPTSK